MPISTNESKGIPSDRKTQRARVLVVDDEPLLRELMATVLEAAGHTVTLAGGAREGLLIAARDPFDLAIVDYEMPGTNGLRVLDELRELQPHCQRILCSGNLDVPTVIEAVNRGEITRVLAKPVDRALFLEAVDESLEARDLQTGPNCWSLEKQRQDLEECLGNDYVSLALQPICARDRSVTAFEALLRSSHPVLDSPVAVLRAAEAHSQLDALADVIADLSLERMAELAGDWKLFINAHPKELTNPALLEKRLARLADHRHRLVIEITERTYLLELKDWATSIRMLSDAGFELAVDDLGAGYNSLVVLAELQPNYLKVDMSMIRNVHNDERKQRLIEMLVKFAESTNARVVAEGIEVPEEAAALLDCGVHMLQGYWLGRPTTDIEESRARLAAEQLPL